ncbi:MAG TPA: protein arginine kinase [Candidatus Krumholzibacteria bacterium]|nr:protein arginine kinase [Candidatus Krumholzibacteria bacterium]
MSSIDWNDVIARPGAWLAGGGEENEIVLSSRVRIARNLHGHRFTHNCDNAELGDILRKSLDAARATRAFAHSRYVPMGEISTLDRQLLAERHLVSREFISQSASRGLLFVPDESVSLMINEEDHLRIQGFAPGFDVGGAFRLASDLDDEIGPGLDIAYNDRLGFLTACPTNLGTGMRVSVLIHLPGLVHSKEIHKLLESLRKLNHSIRGFFGEGSEVMGNFFQLSNSAALGTPEDVLVKNLREMVTKVIVYERRSREMLFRKAQSLLEDKVWRAYGLLRYARTVSTKESLSLISAVRLGVGAGLVTDVPIQTLNELLVYIQPAHLQKRKGTTMDAQQRDVARAEHIRGALARAAR